MPICTFEINNTCPTAKNRQYCNENLTKNDNLSKILQDNSNILQPFPGALKKNLFLFCEI